MNTPSAKLLVLVGEKFSCVKIVGRANFNSSVDFKTLVNELRQKGYAYFVLELSECLLMDSTFLGVLTGFGLQLGQGKKDPCDGAIELLNANPRITDLLENLGRSEEHTSELQSRQYLVCRLLLEKKKKT